MERCNRKRLRAARRGARRIPEAIENDNLSAKFCFLRAFVKIQLAWRKSSTEDLRKMQILLADEYGFCFGVERAVEMVEEALGEGQPIRSLGALIHNAQEMQRLEAKGVTTIDSPEQADPAMTAVIRA